MDSLGKFKCHQSTDRRFMSTELKI
ncbi:Protein CBG25210 [Caenorhabditis briggsae]|uniref:Protein CBG25210 n=1 Tax=Caenorhabditis briggsae TaxID=6238 RepID=B6IJG8_CAEBR|nr:Protein CBG25210 [Caenorhabditis briggsae]CAS00048.1 Protein CBG25210 [Caenorhabditis briggsae]